MKILIVSMRAPSLINLRASLIKELTLQNHDVYVTAPKTEINKNIINKLNKIGAKYLPIDADRTTLNPLANLFIIISLMKLLVRNQFHTIFSYTVKPVIFSGIVVQLMNIFRTKNNIKHIALITGLGFAFTNGRNKTKRFFLKVLLKFLYKISLLNAKAIIFQNSDDRDFFEKSILLNKNIELGLVAGSGVNLDVFKEEKVASEHVFLMLSRLNEDKGVKEYIEAAKILKLKYPNYIFRLAGHKDYGPSGIDEIYLEKVIEDGYIDYLGHLIDVREELKKCRYYVLPSYREGMPRSVLEALAVGRPIITSDVPGCRDTVNHGINGYLVKSKSVKSLTDYMLKLSLLEDTKINLMCQESLTLAKKKFSDIEVNKKIVKIIES